MANHNNLPCPSSALLLLLLFLGVSTHLVLIPTAAAARARGGSVPTKLGSGERYGRPSYFPVKQKASSSSASQPLVSDQSRVRHLNAAADQNLGEGTKVPVGQTYIGDGNYVVKVGFGTPRQDYWLILDTGSDITWLQCQPCSVRCYNQQDPIFNPSSSSTFANATCSGSTSTCNYYSNYVDKSYSNGYYAKDTLTLSDSEQYPNFTFGCGQDNSNNFGTAAGILGAGMGEVSLVNQIAPVQIFCYCLPGTEGYDGFFVFGLQALESCDTTNLVPFTRNPKRPSLFFVDLVGISIGGKRINISGSGTILDSGTVISRLPPSVYTALVAEFRRIMSGYEKADPSPPLLDVCYDLAGRSAVTFPSMRLHFGSSVDVTLGPSSGVRQEGRSKWCLAFAPNERETDLIIIGNNQQRDFRMLHNVQDGIIGFGYAGGCNIGG